MAAIVIIMCYNNIKLI